jgi:hypothetical protein
MGIKWSGWRVLPPLPFRSERNRLLLTIHPDKMAVSSGYAPDTNASEATEFLITP